MRTIEVIECRPPLCLKNALKGYEIILSLAPIKLYGVSISGSRLPSPTPVNINSDSSLFSAKTGIAILS